MEIQRSYNLSKIHTLGMDVMAKWYAAPSSIEEVLSLLSESLFRNERRLIIGGGSNLLFIGDFNGLLIKPSIDGIEIYDDDEHSVYLKVGAGIVWDDLVRYAVDRGWGGLENLSYIPGTVGASPVQNIGAYGIEAKDCIYQVEYIDIDSGEVVSVKGEECEFGYRDSIFKRRLKDLAIITSVIFKLSKYPELNLSYSDLAKTLSSMDHEPDIYDVRNAVIAIRKEKLPDPSEVGNVGSFFKNPIITLDKAQSLTVNHPEIKIYPVDGDFCKIPAGWLIEQCGFKGIRSGNVGVHNKQALVLLAYNGATGQELYDFAMLIKSTVLQQFNIEIEPEVNLIFS